MESAGWTGDTGAVSANEMIRARSFVWFEESEDVGFRTIRNVSQNREEGL